MVSNNLINLINTMPIYSYFALSLSSFRIQSHMKLHLVSSYLAHGKDEAYVATIIEHKPACILPSTMPIVRSCS
jgi:hypothetical protein